MSRRGWIFLLVLLVILLIAINYNFLDKKISEFVTLSEDAIVSRVIDGDTIVLGDGRHVRLLGINTPEKKEKFDKEAVEFTNKSLFNKTISLEYGKDKIDLYNRTLAYIYLNNELYNIKLVENGLANFYFPEGKDRHYSDFKKAWENCVIENKNLCEKSKINCVELEKLDVKTQTIILKNNCNYDLDLTNWDIKDEGRKHFVFGNFILKKTEEVEIVVGEGTNIQNKIYWERSDYVWTRTGDTLFLRDDEGKLVLWENY